MFPGGYCGGLGIAGWLLMIGFWVALLAVAVWAVARLFPSAGQPDNRPESYDPGRAPGQSAVDLDKQPHDEPAAPGRR